VNFETKGWRTAARLWRHEKLMSQQVKTPSRSSLSFRSFSQSAQLLQCPIRRTKRPGKSPVSLFSSRTSGESNTSSKTFLSTPLRAEQSDHHRRLAFWVVNGRSWFGRTLECAFLTPPPIVWLMRWSTLTRQLSNYVNKVRHLGYGQRRRVKWLTTCRLRARIDQYRPKKSLRNPFK
jgi:hypothetical protein